VTSTRTPDFSPSEAGYADRFRAITATIQDEESRFAKNVSSGADRVGEAISDLRRRGEATLSGETVFRYRNRFAKST